MKNQTLKILCVVGARPNFMKIAPIIDAIKRYNKSKVSIGKKKLKYTLVHTGQHYDEVMSKQFFDELDIPRPDVNLEVGSLSHAEQTAEIMKRFEPVLQREQPDFVILVGDVNSTIACALVCAKIQYHSGNRTRPVIIHVEAGLRSFDRSMPEEINRILTDAISDVLFTTEEDANKNLHCEGIKEDKIHFVGNVMIDTLLKHRKKAEQSDILQRLDLIGTLTDASKSGKRAKKGTVTPYAVLTLHRPSNVDEKKTFQGILEALTFVGMNMPVIFPVHPRTLIRIKEFGFNPLFNMNHYKFNDDSRSDMGGSSKSKIFITEPLGYLDFLHLMANARLVLTDSGGIQEETTILGVNCITLRENTERPITVTQGTNNIAGTGKLSILNAYKDKIGIESGTGKTKVPKFWDGRAADRIVRNLTSMYIKDTFRSQNPN